ncbi:putative DNA-directed RNA polymerase II subunit RPB1-like [Iris pallida]|uniref:DNA-directed RNA polymerase II subunit RPB1-like n=1 Tax=Iris pallida TaxID=29817 RepID=A0AAX6F1E4_IRIPA|nr:putative DNA-directed RNA polymerase II subunit RPB1-like [Iris pallida]
MMMSRCPECWTHDCIVVDCIVRDTR